ncbi:MAG: hypothetical protein Q8Q14_14075, partial [Gemmatimonadales bacterium]|nr:hypothetical protein [Gemmatimonadales bacterium]
QASLPLPSLVATVTVSETLTASQVAQVQGAATAVGGLIAEGPVTLPIGAVADGQALVRSGSALVGGSAGGGSGVIIAAAVGNVTVSGSGESLVYNLLSLEAATIPSIGDYVEITVLQIHGTFAAGTDNQRLKVAGVSLGDNAMALNNLEVGRTIYRVTRVDADSLLVHAHGERQTALLTPQRLVQFDAVAFPVALDLYWQGGHASNATTFKSYQITVFNS